MEQIVYIVATKNVDQVLFSHFIFIVPSLCSYIKILPNDIKLNVLGLN